MTEFGIRGPLQGLIGLSLTLSGLLAFAAPLDKNPFPSTYVAPASPDTAIIGATILTGDGGEISPGYVVIRGGRITAMGEGAVPVTEKGITRVIDGHGRWLTPGIIDVHSHLGNYASPSYAGTSDGNEATAPVTAKVWTEHSVWPQDPQFPLALAGGVTTLQILPGSANLIGGRSVVLKNVSSRTVQGMKFPDAPYGLKMACGENPKRVYGEKGGPSTRMGNVAGYRASWIKAAAYREKWEKYDRDMMAYNEPLTKRTRKKGKVEEPVAPERDLEMDTLRGVLDGEILVHNHCYRADEMAQMIDVSKEFGYQITSFQHAVESYKIADLLAENGICSAMWADWTRFKLESFDGIDENVALVDKAQACAIVHSDSPWGIQRLNQEAAKAMAAGNRMGMSISGAHAMQWLTMNPAKSLGIEQQTGSISVSKMADLVLWSADPFSVYSRPEKVMIDGVLVLDEVTGLKPVTDFELGLRGKTL
ncbi:MAG: imidazolonepropionase-like amidohydrolase [Candidatus Azotimanducaceae bacterium]|jgi:imidazolonepropionase-like amidohydrolase